MDVGLYTQTYGLGRTSNLQAQIASSQPPSPTTQQQNVLASAIAAQRTAPAQQTQTASAAQATGRSESSRETRSNTDTGAANDTNANALSASTSRLAVQPRGSRVDVFV